MSAVSDAYVLLGLEQGASMDQVRSAYKQLALRTHPDKNHGNAEATAQFQRISEAYTVLQSYHAPSEPLHYCPCGRAHDSDGDDDDDYDDYFEYDYDDDDDDEYFYFDEECEDAEERLKFFRHLFEEVFSGRSERGYARTQDPRRTRHRKAPETREEYEARLKREREEREQAEARRAQQKVERKAFEARMREKERKEAEERQRAKAASRKVHAESQRKKAAETAQLERQRVQTLRSAAFAAARAGEAVKVRKSVWEDEVDPAGGEVKMGCENYVRQQPDDPTETLLHIAALNGDADLVEWLDAHSADPEERNSFGLSAFHVALQHGHIQILKRFFESYDPKEEDHDAIYHLPPPRSLLSLALDSAEPEVVWMILDRGLATTQDIGNAWTEVTSLEGKQALLGKDKVKYTEIQNLLMSYGGFTPPPTPKVPSQGNPSTDKAEPSRGSPGTREGFPRRGRGAHRGKHRTAQSQGSPASMQNGHAGASWRPPPEHGQRGKTRGRGRGRGRGYGRGRGRGGHAN